MITWRLASAADIESYYGGRPQESMRAIVILLDGVHAGIIGLAYERDRMRAFSESKPELDPFLKSMPVLRAIKAAQKMFSESKRPVFAVQESCTGILERLGFVQVEGEVYRWPS